MSQDNCLASENPSLVGDPVDTLTGAVLDRQLEFRLTGPLEFRWYRHYDSSQCERRLACGWGHTHDYDRTLRFDADGISYHGHIGRPLGFPPLMEDGERCMMHGCVLRRVSLTEYQIFRQGEPTMEFSFRETDKPARLTRVFEDTDEIRFIYGTTNRLERIVDSAGREIRAVEDEEGRVVSLTLLDAKGRDERLLISYQYDPRGNMVRTVNASGGGHQYAYDPQNRLIRRTGRKGFNFRFTYDAEGRCRRASGDDRLYEVSLEFEIPGRVTKVTRADGGVWTYFFDESGALTQIIDPLGGVQKYVRDKGGRVIEEVDPNGNATRVIYDDSGTAVAKMPPLGHAVSIPEDPNAPDPLAHRVAANPAEYEFGHLLDLNSIVLPDTEAARYFSPGEIQRLVFMRPAAVMRQEKKDRFEVRPIGVQWWPGPEKGRIFSALGKLEKQHDDWGRARQWNYDESGNVAEHVDFDGATWRHGYGSWHFLRELTNPVGATVKFTYTEQGEVASFTDAGGARSEYAYDAKDQLTEVRRHGKVRDRYVRDAAGNLLAKHGTDGSKLLEFEIGPGNLPLKRTLSSGDEHSFKYDAFGRHIAAATKKDVVTFAYDYLGNCSAEKRNGLGVEHRFGDVARLAESVFFGTFKVTYERREDGTLVITDPGGQKHRIAFLPHGIVERRLGNGSQETAQYDSQGRCLFKYTRRTKGQVWSRRYHWSGEGDLQRVEDSLNGEVRHEYDAAHRLRRRTAGGRTEEFEMDAADNLVRQPGLTNVTLQEGNRLTSASGHGIAYNDRNHIAERRTADGDVRYFYDSRDQLIRAETPQGAWAADYDALGRRTRKTWDGETTEFYWYGDQLVAEVSGDGRVRLHIYADPLAMTPLLFLDYASVEAAPESCVRHFIFTDQIGTPCLIEDSAGAEVWRARIEPFGAAQIASGADITFNLRFPGHYFDAELGLHYNRFRHYDPKIGRYVQSDPWGITGGNNLYAYRLNPLLQVDVRGLGEENSPNCKPKADEEGSKPPSKANEEPPAQKVAQKGEDLGQLAKEAGMEKGHLENLSQRSQDNNEIIVVRASNPESLQYHGEEGHTSKPVDCKFKTDKEDGLVKRPPGPMSESDQAHMNKLEQKGWTSDANGNMIDPNGNKVYGDHDLQGAYHKDPFSGEVSQVNTNDPAYQKGLNDDVCPENKMINHGANDNYKDPNDPSKMGRTPGPDESYVVTHPDGTVTQVNGTDNLRKYYEANNMPWPY